MLSKRLIKYFKSLQLKKYRHQEGKFIVEGAKGVVEVLQSGFNVDYLLVTSDFKSSLSAALIKKAREVIEVKESDLQSVGTFLSNNAAIAIVDMLPSAPFSMPAHEHILALDDVRDPGNLGTIIRIADWYGIKQIVCSLESADFYNPKVINSSMGSFTRVKVGYADLEKVLAETQLPVYGALLEGENIYKSDLSKTGVILMGNESQGINKALEPFITNSIHIPRRGGAESLNVAIATAVILDNFFR
ncbi:MAG: TrmH family RNA methyltransferase [Roseivirga sp.]|jgi:TrmH family RNA methyltransferase